MVLTKKDSRWINLTLYLTHIHYVKPIEEPEILEVINYLKMDDNLSNRKDPTYT